MLCGPRGKITRVRTRPISGEKGPARAKMTWAWCVKNDLESYGVTRNLIQGREVWRSSDRNC